ncbi:MAG: GNAT family N-acetyltransferase [Actinomycetota bacterium]|nr:GNAT family N-acetyltransferase [Actinomycetota bacterium]
MTEEERQLFMRLPVLTEVGGPRQLPDGYELRIADRSEYAGVGSVLSAAFEEPWDELRVEQELGPSKGVEAVFVVAGRPGVVATASARLLPATYPGSGYVHYVGVHPDARGRAFGEAVSVAVVHYFANRGLTDAVLETDAFRIPALRTYFRLGFVPEYRQSNDAARWSRVMRALFARGVGGSVAK